MGLFGFDPRRGGLLGQIKRKIFVSYHHGGDRDWYDAFSRTFCDQYEVVKDNSPGRAIDSDDADYVRWCLSADFITGSSCTIVLIGRDTWGRRFVDWEIDLTLQKEHGLIGVVLPTGGVAPPRLQDNVRSRYAPSFSWARITGNATTLTQAIEIANHRPKGLINNTRERRYRSASSVYGILSA
jgi:Thoeris protein ThsB, TIR-like domain